MEKKNKEILMLLNEKRRKKQEEVLPMKRAPEPAHNEELKNSND